MKPSKTLVRLAILMACAACGSSSTPAGSPALEDVQLDTGLPPVDAVDAQATPPDTGPVDVPISSSGDTTVIDADDAPDVAADTADVPVDDAVIPTDAPDDVAADDVAADEVEDAPPPEDTPPEDSGEETGPGEDAAEDIALDDAATEDTSADEDVEDIGAEDIGAEDTEAPPDVPLDDTEDVPADAAEDVPPACGSDSECADGSACTKDVCDAMLGCVHVHVAGPCDDGDACTSGDHCALGGCVSDAFVECGDGDGCNGLERCDPAAGCLPGVAIVCDDGHACNGVEACQGGACAVGVPMPCDDAEPCTADGCENGACVSVPIPGPCDDGDACTELDACSFGSCAGTPKACDDGDACTVEACAAGTCTAIAATEAPVLAVSGVPAGATVDEPVSLTVTTTGPSRGNLKALVDDVAYTPGSPISGEGSHQLKATITACDGSVVSLAHSFRIDPAPPVITASVWPAPGETGWVNRPATVTFSADDAALPLASLTEPILVSTQGQGVIVTGKAVDSAGHEATVTVTLDLDFKPPSIAITAPKPNLDSADQYVTGETEIVLTGTVTGDTLSGFAGGEISSSKLETRFPITAPGPYEVTIPLRAGVNSVIVSARDVAGNVGTASLCIVRDDEPPRVAIQFPPDGAAVFVPSVTVSGLAHDLVVGSITEEDISVVLNGVVATVQNGRFIAMDVPLTPGANTLTATATDAAGRMASHSSTLRFELPAGRVLERVSGDGQSGEVRSELTDPLVVRATDPGVGPVAGVDVLFAVSDGDGILDAAGATGKGPESREVLVKTDAGGLASARFSVGGRSGAGQHRVTATAPGASGSALFTATAEPGPAVDLFAHAGASQVGATNTPLPMPLAVFVTDSDKNPVAGVPVTYDVIAGDGKIGGSTSMTVLSNGRGFADIVFTPGDETGPGAHVVRASVHAPADASDTALGVDFVATAIRPGLVDPEVPERTRVHGVILDQDQAPLPGVSVRFLGRDPSEARATDATGAFRLVAPPGFGLLEIDGATAAKPGSNDRYPKMVMEVQSIPGVDTPIERPIYLLKLDPGVFVDGSQTVVLGVASLPGYALTIAAGTKLTFPDGSHEGFISVTQVNFDQAPMAPVNGLQSRVLVTIQPAGVRFDPPAALTMPNVDGYPPHAKVDMFSYDHDVEAFVPVGTGTVTPDGALVESDPGVGVVKGGWHCGSNPQPNGACANVTAKLADPMLSASAARLKADGRPGQDTRWQWCASGSIETQNSPCVNNDFCFSNAKPTNGQKSGIGVVKVIHSSTVDPKIKAQDVKVVQICEQPPYKQTVGIQTGFEPIQKMVDLVDKFKGPFAFVGCKPDFKVNFNANAEVQKTCCTACPTLMVDNVSVKLGGDATGSVDCAVPSLGQRLDVGVFSVEVGFFAKGSLAAKLEGSLSADNCYDPAYIAPKVSIGVTLKVEGRFTLAKVTLGKTGIIDVNALVNTAITGKGEASDKGLDFAACWDGIQGEATLKLADLTLYKRTYIFVCPREILRAYYPLKLPPLPGFSTKNCKGGPITLEDPKCGTPVTIPPYGGPPPVTPPSPKGPSNPCSLCPGNVPQCRQDIECDDSDLCNGMEWCDTKGTCNPGTPLSCDPDAINCTTLRCDATQGCLQEPDHAFCGQLEGVACTTDVCDLTLGCQYFPDDSLCPDDGFVCTEHKCDNTAIGGCRLVPKDTKCDDGFACTDDFCDPFLGCKNTEKNALCPVDGIDCTLDACRKGVGCINEPDSSKCPDGLACTTDECVKGTGCRWTPNDAECDDGFACTMDRCDPIGACAHVPDPTTCDDGISCTDDRCEIGVGCTHTAMDSLCQNGGCDDDTCNPAAAGCVHTPNDGSCIDAFACTRDTCLPSGTCSNAPDNSLCLPNQTCGPPCVTIPGGGSGGGTGSGCTTAAQCPGGGQWVCAGGNPVTFSCASGACVSTPASCQPGQTGTYCVGNAIAQAACGATGVCQETVTTFCGDTGQVCASGSCVAP